MAKKKKDQLTEVEKCRLTIASYDGLLARWASLFPDKSIDPLSDDRCELRRKAFGRWMSELANERREEEENGQED